MKDGKSRGKQLDSSGYRKASYTDAHTQDPTYGVCV